MNHPDMHVSFIFTNAKVLLRANEVVAMQPDMDMLGLRNALKNLSWLGRAAVLCFYVAISNQFIRMVLSSSRE